MSASVGETPEIKALCEEYRALNPKYVAIETRIKFIKERLRELSGGKTVLSAGVKVTTSERKGRINYGDILGIQKMTEDGSIEKYRGPSTQITKVTVVGD